MINDKFFKKVMIENLKRLSPNYVEFDNAEVFADSMLEMLGKVSNELWLPKQILLDDLHRILYPISIELRQEDMCPCKTCKKQISCKEKYVESIDLITTLSTSIFNECVLVDNYMCRNNERGQKQEQELLNFFGCEKIGY